MKDNLEFLDSLRHLQVSSFLLCLEQVSLFFMVSYFPFSEDDQFKNVSSYIL